MNVVRSLWASVQGDPVFMRKVNGWLVFVWLGVGVVGVAVDGIRTSIRNHYEHWRKTGDPILRLPTPADRFWAKVNKTDTCWVWTARVDAKGYGQFKSLYRQWKAHRWAWEQTHGPVPEGLELDHLCHNRACVNPVHLEVVTHAENMARGVQATATHCKRGHPLSGSNLSSTPTQKRICRACVIEGRRRAKRGSTKGNQ